MGAKIIAFLLTLTLFSTVLADVRFFPNRTRTPSRNRYPVPSAFLSENTDDDILNRRLQAETNYTEQPVTMRLKGDTALGYYYVTMFFGTPLQRQTLIVDTGSMTTTIPCSECGDNCGKNHFNQPFNHNASSTFEKFQCDESFGEYKCSECASQCPFGVFYVEGSSYSGHFSRDFVVFGNEIEDNFSILDFTDENNTSQTAIDLELDTSGNETIIPDFASNNTNDSTDDLERQAQQALIRNIIEERKVFIPFGCTYRETKLFYEQEADGILGLGINTNTFESPPNLLDAINLHNQSLSKAFSLCLAQQGGYFSVGGYNHAYHVPEETIQFVEYFTEYGQFRVVINKIEVGGKDIDLNMSVLNKGEGAFFDSGTTLTYLPTPSYNAVVNTLTSFCSENSTNCANGKQGEKLCWRYDKTEFPTQAEFLATFPTLKFYFGEDGTAEYNWQPEDYFYEKEAGKYCIGISRYDRETILGATFMKNHDILFDKQNKRVGMVRANCAAVMNVTTPIYTTHELLPTQEEPNQEPTSESTQEPTQESNQEPTQEPNQEPTQEPTEESNQEPTQESNQDPNQEPTQESNQEPTQESNQDPNQETTQESTQEPTQESNQEPTQESNQEPTQESNQDPNQEPTQEPTEESNQEPTEESNQDPNQEATQEPLQDKPIEKESGQVTPVMPTEMTQISRPRNPEYWRILLLGLGIVAVSAILGVAIFYCIRYYRRKRNYDDMGSDVELPSRRGTGTSANTSMEHQPSTPQAQKPASITDVQIPVQAPPKMVISVTD